MNIQNILFSVHKKKKITLIIPSLQLWDFLLVLQNEFETAVVNERSVFEPLYCACLFRLIMIYTQWP